MISRLERARKLPPFGSPPARHWKKRMFAPPPPARPDAFIFSLRLPRDSAWTIHRAEISREIGRVKWVSIRALMGVSYVRISGNYYNEPFSRIFHDAESCTKLLTLGKAARSWRRVTLRVKRASVRLPIRCETTRPRRHVHERRVGMKIFFRERD